MSRGTRTVLSFTPEEEKLAEYLLSEEYRRQLYRAVLTQRGVTCSHHEEHQTALLLLQAAYPGIKSGGL